MKKRTSEGKTTPKPYKIIEPEILVTAQVPAYYNGKKVINPKPVVVNDKDD